MSHTCLTLLLIVQSLVQGEVGRCVRDEFLFEGFVAHEERWLCSVLAGVHFVPHDGVDVLTEHRLVYANLVLFAKRILRHLDKVEIISDELTPLVFVVLDEPRNTVCEFIFKGSL